MNGSAPTSYPSALRQCVELVLKDLRLELRAREVGFVIAPFGAVALLLIPMAIDTNTPLLRQLGPGMYWMVVLLFGVLIALRDTAVDTAEQLAVLRLLGIDPAILQMGRAMANSVLVLVFEVLLVPVSIALYNPDLTGWPWMLLGLPLVAGGLALLGTIANSLARGLSGRSTIGPLLVIPIAVPLLLAAAQATRAAALGRAPWPWLLLIAVVDIAAILLLLLTADHQEETV